MYLHCTYTPKSWLLACPTLYYLLSQSIFSCFGMPFSCFPTSFTVFERPFLFSNVLFLFSNILSSFIIAYSVVNRYITTYINLIRLLTWGVTNRDMSLFMKSMLWECYKTRHVTKRDVLVLATLRYVSSDLKLHNQYYHN